MELMRGLKLLATLTLLCVAQTVWATPDYSKVVVNGYLRRSNGTPIASGDIAGTTTVSIRAGGTPVTGCTYSATTFATDATLSNGYFSLEVPCNLTNLAAASGQLSSEVAVFLDGSGTATNFDANVYAVPLALVAAMPADGSVTNASVSATAAIALSKLATSGYTTGDLMQYNGTAWTNATVASLGLATTTATNPSISVTAGTFGSVVTSGNETAGSFTTAGTIGVTGAAVLGSLTTTTVAATNVTATGTLGLSGNAVIGGNATVTGDISAANVSASGTLGVVGASVLGSVSTSNIAASGTLGVTGAAVLGSLSTSNIASSGTLGMSGGATFGGHVNVPSLDVSGSAGITGAYSVPVAMRSAMGFTQTGGTSTAYTLAASGFELDDGAMITFQANASSGAAATINVNSTGATAMKNALGGTAIGANDLVKNGLYRAYYSASASAFMVEKLPTDALPPSVSVYTALGGTATAYTLAVANFQLYHGATVLFTVGATANSAGVTLNVSGTGNIAMADANGVNLVASALALNGSHYKATYDGSVDKWIVQSAPITGVCQIPTTTTTTSDVAKVCAGAPATGANIYCNPTIALTAASVPAVRTTGTIGSVYIRGSTAGATTSTYNCYWIQY